MEEIIFTFIFSYSGTVDYFNCIRRKALDGRCPCRAKHFNETGEYTQFGRHNHTTEWSEPKRIIVINEALTDLKENPTCRVLPKKAFNKAHGKQDTLKIRLRFYLILFSLFMCAGIGTKKGKRPSMKPSHVDSKERSESTNRSCLRTLERRKTS